MKRAAKVDVNQAEIVAAFRRRGASVAHLHTVGAGVPDLLIGFLGQNFLCEVKDGKKPPSQRQLTTAQVKWHEEWNGKVFIVGSVDEALEILDLAENR